MKIQFDSLLQVCCDLCRECEACRVTGRYAHCPSRLWTIKLVGSELILDTGYKVESYVQDLTVGRVPPALTIREEPPFSARQIAVFNSVPVKLQDSGFKNLAEVLFAIWLEIIWSHSREITQFDVEVYSRIWGCDITPICSEDRVLFVIDLRCGRSNLEASFNKILGRRYLRSKILQG